MMKLHAQDIQQPYVGELQAFYAHEPPLAVDNLQERQAHTNQLASVKWFGYSGCNTTCTTHQSTQEAFSVILGETYDLVLSWSLC